MVSAGQVSWCCSSHPPPVSVSREQLVCGARLGLLPVLPLCHTERGGEQRDVAQRRGKTTEEAGKIHLFIPALFVESPVQLLIPCVLLPCFHLLYPAHLSLCPTLGQTPNPARFTPHSFLNPKSVLPSLLALFNCSPHTSLTSYPPPPSSPLSLSHLNMPPLSITLLHTPDDWGPPYSLSFISWTFCFCFSCFFLCCIPFCFYCTTLLLFSLYFHYVACIDVPLRIVIRASSLRVFTWRTYTMQLSEEDFDIFSSKDV